MGSIIIDQLPDEWKITIFKPYDYPIYSFNYTAFCHHNVIKVWKVVLRKRTERNSLLFTNSLAQEMQIKILHSDHDLLH